MELYFENVKDISFIINTDGITSVNWGDGRINKKLSHTYKSPYTGVVIISITGSTYAIFGNNNSQPWYGIDKLVKIKYLENNEFTSITNGLNGAINLTNIPKLIIKNVNIC